MAGLGDAEATAALARVVALLGESAAARDGALSAEIARVTARDPSWGRVWQYFRAAPAEPSRRVALVDVLREAAGGEPTLIGRLDDLLTAASPDFAGLPSPRAAPDAPGPPPPRSEPPEATAAAEHTRAASPADTPPSGAPGDADPSAMTAGAAGPHAGTSGSRQPGASAEAPPEAGGPADGDGPGRASATRAPGPPGRLAVLVHDHPVLVAVTGAGAFVVILVVLGIALSSGHPNTPHAVATPSYSVPPAPTAGGDGSSAPGAGGSAPAGSATSTTSTGPAGSTPAAPAGGAAASPLSRSNLIVLAHCDTSGNLDVTGYDPGTFAQAARQTIDLGVENTVCKSGDNPATLAYATRQVLTGKARTFAVTDGYNTFLPNPAGTLAVTGDGTQGGGSLQTQPLHAGKPEQQATTTFSSTRRGDDSVLAACQAIGWTSDTTLLCAPGRTAQEQGLWLVDLGTLPASGGNGTAASVTPLTLPSSLLAGSAVADTLLSSDDADLLLVLETPSGGQTVYTVALPGAAALATPPAAGLPLRPVPVASGATKAAAAAFAPVGYAQDPVFPISWTP